MKFKNFLLEEGFNFSNVKVGDILSAFQQLSFDIDNIKKKDLKNTLENIILNMRSLLNSKSDKILISVIQKIICAIKDDIEVNGDFKSTIESSIYELEKYLKDKKVVLNNPIENSKDQSVSDPVKDDPVDVKNNQELNTPPDKNFSRQDPPLAGTGDNLSNIV
jgi:hypothetical protein